LSKIDFYFLQGRFTYGLKIIPTLEKQLKTYEVYLDTHRIMVFYYKIACLYFGSGNYDKAIDYLHKIINQKAHLRNDLQCYARLLHLIAHYELKNYDILESLIKSVYRFMGNMDNLSTVELAIFEFIRKSFSYNILHLEEAFITLHKKLTTLKNKKVENRSFVYLDVLSWLESKIQKQAVEVVIRKKFLEKSKSL
jgi:tetratricopeptide (TPR) repeat protein